MHTGEQNSKAKVCSTLKEPINKKVTQVAYFIICSVTSLLIFNAFAITFIKCGQNPSQTTSKCFQWSKHYHNVPLVNINANFIVAKCNPTVIGSPKTLKNTNIGPLSPATCFSSNYCFCIVLIISAFPSRWTCSMHKDTS